jgi:hypothetical protein
MRILSTLAAVAAFTGGAFAQPPVVPAPAVPLKGEVPMPMPKPEPMAKVVPDRPHKIFVGEWEMLQYLRPYTLEKSHLTEDRPFPQGLPITKGTIEFRDDLTFTWAISYHDRNVGKFDTIAGTYQVIDQKIVMTRKTPLGETFTYNFTHLDIVDGKVIRPIGANCYEEWSRIPPKPKKD